MDSTRYVQIPCQVCGGKNLAIGGQPRPAECVHCKAPLDGRPPERAQSSGARPSDPAKRAPATFARGTFTHDFTQTPAEKPRPSASTRPPSNASKTGHVAAPAPGSLKDRLLRLLPHR